MDTEDKIVLPSARADNEEQQRKAQEDLQANVVAAMREDFGRCFGTDHGKRVLAWMCERAGYNKSKVAIGKGGIDKDMSVFLAQEEAFYLEIRKHIPINILMEIEYGGIKPSGSIDNAELNKHSGKRKRT